MTPDPLPSSAALQPLSAVALFDAGLSAAEQAHISSWRQTTHDCVPLRERPARDPPSQPARSMLDR